MANCRLLFRCVGSGTDQQSHRCFVAERQHTGRWFVTLGLGGPDVSDGSIASFERCRHVCFTPDFGRTTATHRTDALGHEET